MKNKKKNKKLLKKLTYNANLDKSWMYYYNYRGKIYYKLIYLIQSILSLDHTDSAGQLQSIINNISLARTKIAKRKANNKYNMTFSSINEARKASKILNKACGFEKFRSAIYHNLMIYITCAISEDTTNAVKRLKILDLIRDANNEVLNCHC